MLKHPTHERLLGPRPYRHGQGARSEQRCQRELRRSPSSSAGAAARSRGDLPQRPAPGPSSPACPAAPPCRPRGRRHYGAARARSGLFEQLVAGDWIDRDHNRRMIGPTGVGKSWLACALGHKACRDDRSVLYHRVPRLLDAHPRPGRRPLRPNGRPRPGRSPDPRRLGSYPDRSTKPRPARNPRRPLRSSVNARHQPGPYQHWHEVIAGPTSPTQSSIASSIMPTA